MEPVHILGGHPIYEMTSLEEALKITQKWKKEGKWGQKPRFRYKLDNPTKDTGLYGFKEIETDSSTKSGFRLTKVSKLLSTAAKRRGIVKKAGITRKELIKEIREEWPEASKKDINRFANFFQKQEKLSKEVIPLERIELGRLYGVDFATDHVEALASGEKYTDIHTNRLNIKKAINEFKSGKKGPPEFREFLKEEGLDTPHNRVIRAFRSTKYNKPGSGSIEWNKKMAQIWNSDSNTLNKVQKGGTRGGIFAFLDKGISGDNLKVQGDGTAVLANEAVLPNKVNLNNLVDLGNIPFTKHISQNIASSFGAPNIATNIALNPSLMEQIGARIHKGKPIDWKGFGKELGKDIAWDTVFGGVTLAALKRLGPLAPALMVKPIYSAADAYVEGATGKSITDRYEQYREDKAPFSEKRIAESGLIPKYIEPNTKSGVAELKQYNPSKDWPRWTP